ncbi:MAG: hypothetical protein ACRCUY_00340, partial [Thermoguttaceae bacterium]
MTTATTPAQDVTFQQIRETISELAALTKFAEQERLKMQASWEQERQQREQERQQREQERLKMQAKWEQERQQREQERQQRAKEAEKQAREDREHWKKSEKRWAKIEAISKQNADQWGKLVETLVNNQIVPLLRARNILIRRTVQRVKGI